MVEVKVDASLLKNELTMLLDAAIEIREETDSNKKRDKFAVLVEKIRTLKTEVSKL